MQARFSGFFAFGEFFSWVDNNSELVGILIGIELQIQ